MDDASYEKLFIGNKRLVIEAVKKLRELEASCDLIVNTEPEYQKIWIQKMFSALLEFKTAKFDLLSKAFYGESPDPYDSQFDDH